MSVIYLMVPIALTLAGAALAGFLWAVHRGQFDDLDTQRYRVLMDDEPSDSISNHSSDSQAGLERSAGPDQ